MSSRWSFKDLSITPGTEPRQLSRSTFALTAPDSRSLASRSSPSIPTFNSPTSASNSSIVAPNSSIPISNSPTLPSNSSASTLPSVNRYDELTISFLKAINAKPVKGLQHCFEIGGDGYAAAISRLQQSDPDTFAAVSDGNPRFDIFKDMFMVLKMPEKFKHAVSAIKVSALIIKHIEVLRATYPEDSYTWRFLKDIEQGGTANIPLFNGTSVQPDNQFLVRGDVFPGVTLEMADTQRFKGEKGLDCRMHTMITDSGGRIKTVIGLELNNRRPRLSMCTARFEFQHGCQMFVKRQTVLNRIYLENGGSLELHINNFASKDLIRTSYPGLDQAAKITIPFEEILDAIRPLFTRQKEIDEQRRHIFKDQNIPKPEPFTPSPPAKSKPPRFTKSTLSKSYWYFDPYYLIRGSVGN